MAIDWEEKDPTANFHGGNPFSEAAHEDAKETKEVLRWKVYSLIEASPDGLTCDEVEIAIRRTHQTVSARITELKAEGRLIVVGRRPTRSGSTAGVYVALNPLPT